MATITFNYTIPFNSNIRIGYRLSGSSGPYAYITPFPPYNASPVTISVPIAGLYDLELTTACSSCSGAKYSSPVVVTQISAT